MERIMSKVYLGSSERKGVCVLGAGISGLIAIKYLKNDGCDVLAIEAKSDIGGTWNKSPQREVTQKGIKELYGNYLPEIYENLNTNVHEVFMTFKDMPLRKCEPTTIVPATQFYEHFQAYADKFKLKEHILFNKIVSKIRLTSNLSAEQIEHYGINEKDLSYRYVVIYRETSNDSTTSQAFKDSLIFCDYIVCCNGSYAAPNIPDIRDRSLYIGQEMHTSDYTDMESFRSRLENKRVVVVGSGISGRDMINHIVLGFKGHAPIKVKSLTLVMSSDSDCETFRKAKMNYKEHAKILKTVVGPATAFTGPHSLQAREEAVEADMIIWATGYRHSLPFLEPSDGILGIEQNESRGNYMFPMFLRTFSINQPSFAKLCDPFTARGECILNFERQMSMVTAIFSGRVQLPSKAEMFEELEKSINKLRASGHGLKSICKEIPGVNDLKTLLEEWFKYSGYECRNKELDRFAEQADKAENEFVDNGHFFAPLQLSFKNVSYNGDYSSSSF